MTHAGSGASMRWWACILLLCACEPEVGSRPSLVDRPRILAVRGDPPETALGEASTYRLLAVDTHGTAMDPVASWAFCTEPKPFTENNVVGADCIRDLFAPIGEGPS